MPRGDPTRPCRDAGGPRAPGKPLKCVALTHLHRCVGVRPLTTTPHLFIRPRGVIPAPVWVPFGSPRLGPRSDVCGRLWLLTFQELLQPDWSPMAPEAESPPVGSVSPRPRGPRNTHRPPWPCPAWSVGFRGNRLLVTPPRQIAGFTSSLLTRPWSSPRLFCPYPMKSLFLSQKISRSLHVAPHHLSSPVCVRRESVPGPEGGSVGRSRAGAAWAGGDRPVVPAASDGVDRSDGPAGGRRAAAWSREQSAPLHTVLRLDTPHPEERLAVARVRGRNRSDARGPQRWAFGGEHARCLGRDRRWHRNQPLPGSGPLVDIPGPSVRAGETPFGMNVGAPPCCPSRRALRRGLS